MHSTLPKIRDVVNKTRFRTQQKPFMKTKIFSCCYVSISRYYQRQGCISCGMCSYPELTKDHVLTSAYVNIFRTVTRNALNKSVWRKKDCFWLPLNKHTMNIFIQISNSWPKFGFKWFNQTLASTSISTLTSTISKSA